MPLIFTTLGSDSFTRANENPLSQGGNWTSNDPFSLQIVNNQCVPSSPTEDGLAVYTGVSLPQDRWMQFTIETCTGGSFPFPIVVTGELYVNAGEGTVDAADFEIRATETSLGSSDFELVCGDLSLINQTVNVGDVFRWVSLGNVLYLYQNGVLVVASPTSATLAALYPYVALDVTSFSDGSAAAITNFSCGSVTYTQPPIQVAPQALIQANASPSGSSSQTPSLAFSQNVTAGDLLLVGVAYDSTSAQTFAISDSQGNIYAPAGTNSTTLNSNVEGIALFWTIASASGANTVTVYASASNINIWIALAEFSGASELALDLTRRQVIGTGQNVAAGDTSASLSTSTPPTYCPTGALLVAVGATSGATATWAAGPTNEYKIASQAGGICLAYQLNAYSATPNCDMSLPACTLVRSGDSSSQWAMLLAPFTAAKAWPNTVLYPRAF